MKIPSEIDYARLAAYIDGEGGIRIHLTRSKKTGYVTHLLEIGMSNCDPRLIVWCKDLFGGSAKARSKPRKPNHRPEYKWVIGSIPATNILIRCMPYFIIKGEQAEIALAFRALVGKSGKKVTKELFESRESLRREIMRLNHRGLSIEPTTKPPN